MNRIISLSVEDMYIKYTGEAFGATGSHNAVTLRMTFGPAWEGTAKTAYFTDALGNTSVALVLGLDTLVDGAYEVDVPSEALKTAGVATITIKGVLVSGETTTKAITTAAGHFRVLDSELPDSAGNAGTITPSDKDQLQAEIAGMEALFTTAKAAAEAAAANAKVSETNAKTSETAAASSASSAEASKTAAAESAATATAQASAADASATKAAASQKTAQTSETNAKASEKAAAASQASAGTASASAQGSAAAAAKSAQTAQGAASTATNAASSADQSATSASGFASQAQASAAAAAKSADTAAAQASAASESATSATAAQKAASASESAAKASETAAKAAQTGAETAENNAKDSAEAAAGDAQASQTAASTATGAASTASTAAEAASGSASQASAAATAAAGSAAGAETASKTAKSWAVGGTNTRPGEDTDNAKYWAKQAEAVVGGDFATKNEAQGYVTAHNQSDAAHADIRKALNGKEASGTAATAVSTHNKDTSAHADIREALNGKEASGTAADAVSAHNKNTSAHTDIRNALNGKEASGAAAAAVTAHNEDSAAHADIRNALAGKETAGAAATVQSNLTAHAGNTTVHVTAEQKTTWDGKAAGKHASQHGKNGADPLTPAAIGAASLGADGKVPASQLPEISSVKTYTATIGTTWVEDENTGVKTQSVAIAGVTAQSTAMVDHVYTGSGTSDDYAAFVEAENQYLTCITNGYAETYDGGIKFTIFGDANTVSIPIVAEVS